MSARCSYIKSSPKNQAKKTWRTKGCQAFYYLNIEAFRLTLLIYYGWLAYVHALSETSCADECGLVLLQPVRHRQ